jgi:hypothetical protein
MQRVPAGLDNLGDEKNKKKTRKTRCRSNYELQEIKSSAG